LPDVFLKKDGIRRDRLHQLLFVGSDNRAAERHANGRLQLSGVLGVALNDR